MTMPFALALAGLACVAGFLGLFLYLGQRSGRGDLIAPPSDFGKRPFGKREYGQPPAIRPAPAKPLPQLAAPKAEQTVAELVTDVAEAAPISAAPQPASEMPTEPAPVWRRDRPAGHGRLSEACYTAKQYAEREVKALLLQNRPDRAVRHVRKALKLPAAEAEAFVERLARGLRV